MTGRKTLREIREQLAAARAGAAPPADPSGLLESLDRLADDLGRPPAGEDVREPPTDGPKAETGAATG
jgi:hypothetical protein